MLLILSVWYEKNKKSSTVRSENTFEFTICNIIKHKRLTINYIHDVDRGLESPLNILVYIIIEVNYGLYKFTNHVPVTPAVHI